jgi:hypothetical protein
VGDKIADQYEIYILNIKEIEGNTEDLLKFIM